jgi:hypothetical protein
VQGELSKMIETAAGSPAGRHACGRESDRAKGFGRPSGGTKPDRPAEISRPTFHARAKPFVPIGGLPDAMGHNGLVRSPSMLKAPRAIAASASLPEFSYSHRHQAEELDAPPSDPAWQRAGSHPPADAGRLMQRWRRVLKREQSTLLTIGRLARPAGALFDRSDPPGAFKRL